MVAEDRHWLIKSTQEDRTHENIHDKSQYENVKH